MSLKLISGYGPFLAEHICKYSNPGSGKTSYLSSVICDEVIELLASKGRRIIIIDELKQAKYYSIIVDSTPDISHTDQLSFVVRKKMAILLNVFFNFFPILDINLKS